jgi:hypothetical protein
MSVSSSRREWIGSAWIFRVRVASASICVSFPMLASSGGLGRREEDWEWRESARSLICLEVIGAAVERRVEGVGAGRVGGQVRVDIFDIEWDGTRRAG